ncbi:MAG: hypothetical protein QM758_17625 [Armatimonas sp.]
MQPTLEERVSRIEEELRQLCQEKKSDWRKLPGTFDDDPAFEEILRQGKLISDKQNSINFVD